MTVVDDNYTGHVEPRTAAERTLPGASIVKVSVGPMDNNAYLVTCSQTGETLLIDAANDAEILLELIERFAPKLSLIVTSHQHQDHWLALDEVAKATGVPDRRARTRRRAAAGQAGPRSWPTATPIKVGELSFDVIHLQGHTPGSVALALDGADDAHPPVHRRLPVSRRRRQDLAGGRLRAAARRRQRAGLRRLRRLDGRLPGPRRRHHARRRAAAPRRMARTRLVTAAGSTVAVVTGASRGAGLGIAHALGSHGCTVYVTGRTEGPVSHSWRARSMRPPSW